MGKAGDTPSMRRLRARGVDGRRQGEAVVVAAIGQGRAGQLAIGEQLGIGLLIRGGGDETFLGGLAGGYCYAKLGWELRTLLVCTVVLIASLFYDDLKYKRLKSNGSEVV